MHGTDSPDQCFHLQEGGWLYSDTEIACSAVITHRQEVQMSSMP